MPNEPSHTGFDLSVRPSDATELRQAIVAAFDAAGVAAPADLITYRGPPAGSFGANEGWLQFAGDAWGKLMNVPEAVKILAQGIADYLNKTHVDIRIKSDEVVVRIAGARTVSVDEIVAKLEPALARNPGA
jgi:hypothetical protein